jgi:4-amino-4-deoxy-L-arabinose transferase-like glycosyltransferase
MLGILAAAEGRPVRGFLIVALALGCGLLAKGPTILLQVLPAALLAPWWTTRRPQRGWGAWYGGLLLAFLGGAAIALAWAIPAALRGGDEYAHMLFWGQTADRMVKSFAHRAPFWWYGALAPAILFPWLFWPPLWRALGRLRGHMDPGLRFLIAWALPVFIAFSFISGKQAQYLLPLVPAFALMAARLLATLPAEVTRSSQWLPAVLAILLGIVFGAVPLMAPGFPKAAAWIGDLPLYGGAGLVTWGIILLLAARLSLERAAILVAGISVVLVNTADFAVLRTAGLAYDLRPAARHLKDLENRDVAVSHVGKYHGQFQFLGRLERAPQVVDAGTAGDWFASHPDGRIIAYFVRLPAEVRPDYAQPFAGKTVAILDRRNWELSRQALAPQSAAEAAAGD